MRASVITAVAAVLIGVCAVQAVPVNSNSVIEGGIEYYIETDKAVYELGEDVELFFRMTNLTDELWERGADGAPMSISIESDVGSDDVWTWFWYKGGGWGGGRFRLVGGETKVIGDTWPQVDYRGTISMGDDRPVATGHYYVHGVFRYSIGNTFIEDKVVSVEIAIVPEPGTLCLICIGATVVAGIGREQRRNGW